MGILPHHFLCDHTQLWDFSEFKHEFLEKIFIWPFELILLGGVSSPFWVWIWISFDFFHECKVELILAHYLTEGSDSTTASSGSTRTTLESLSRSSLGMTLVWPRTWLCKMLHTHVSHCWERITLCLEAHHSAISLLHFQEKRAITPDSDPLL